ncbi:hypothetical protein [Cloacibacillus evryensis]|uniref:hypothetical protein n=1 Tax=Cloacibacillus evryensis TaxID=508460 RepID=UPI00370D0281
MTSLFLLSGGNTKRFAQNARAAFWLSAFPAPLLNKPSRGWLMTSLFLLSGGNTKRFNDRMGRCVCLPRRDGNFLLKDFFIVA